MIFTLKLISEINHEMNISPRWMTSSSRQLGFMCTSSLIVITRDNLTEKTKRNMYTRENLGRGFGTSKMHLSPPVTLAAVGSKAVVLLLLIVTPIVGFCNCSIFYVVLYSDLCPF